MTYPSQFLRKAFHPGFTGPAPTTIPPGTLLSADSFNRANAATLVQTDGAGRLDPLTWTNAQGTVGITSSQANAKTIGGSQQNPGGLGAGDAIAHVNLGLANVDISLTFSTLTGGGNASLGLLFRYVDNANYWIWHTRTNSGVNTSTLWKLVAGTFTKVGSDHTGGATNDVMRVLLNGSSITAFRNGSTLETATDSHNASATKHGVFFTNTTGASDNWSVVSV